jgi:hypothetical protein
MKDGKAIRMDFRYRFPYDYNDRYTRYEEGGFGSLIIDTNLEFWIIVKGLEWNYLDHNYADVVVTYLRDSNKDSCTAKDLESSNLRDLLTRYYSFDMESKDYELSYGVKEIPFSDIRWEETLETSLPPSLQIKNINDFRILLSLFESGIRLRIEEI